MKIISSSLIFSLFAFSHLFCGTFSALKTTFIEDLCFMKEKASIQLAYENSGILMSVQRYGADEVFRCELTLIPQRYNSIVLSIYRYDISSGDELTIQDSDRHTIGLIGWATFKDEKKSIISDGKLIINYIKNNTKSSLFTRRAGFQFTFTQVREYSSGKCSSNEYQCKNNKCILKTLACDGHNHCGDNSDQIKCSPETSAGHVNPPKVQSVIWISAIAIAGSILGIITIVFVAVMIKAKVKKTNIPEVQESQSSDGNIPLQSVSATIPSNNSPSQPPENDIQPRETFYNRMRRSFRGRERTHEEEIPTHQENFQVPSMYPKLEQPPTAPQLNGTDNTSFSPEE